MRHEPKALCLSVNLVLTSLTRLQPLSEPVTKIAALNGNLTFDDIALAPESLSMPHFIIDCSESILTLSKPQELMQSVYDAAESTKLFAESGVGGIKVRLNPYSHFLNVDAHAHFVHVFANIMEGRTQEQKKDLSDNVVRALNALLPDVEIISMNVRDFEKATYCNKPMVNDPAI